MLHHTKPADAAPATPETDKVRLKALALELGYSRSDGLTYHVKRGDVPAPHRDRVGYYFTLDQAEVIRRTIRKGRCVKSEATRRIAREVLLKLAHLGVARGDLGHWLNFALIDSILPQGPHYDAEFTERARDLAPGWFLGLAGGDRHQVVKDRNEAILRLAIRGAPRPDYDSILGARLRREMTLSPSFRRQIKALRPDWFTHVGENKAALIRLANARGERPVRRSKLGHALSNYCSLGTCSYDPEFAATIHALRPDWFGMGRHRKPDAG